MVNLCRCFLSIFSNQLITSVVFFHSLSFSFSHQQILILSNIDLLILPISFWAGFISLVVRWLEKFSLWSFKVIKQLLVPLISILWTISAHFVYFMPSLSIISLIPFVVFLYVAVAALSRRWLYSVLLIYTCLRFYLLVQAFYLTILLLSHLCFTFFRSYFLMSSSNIYIYIYIYIYIRMYVCMLWNNKFPSVLCLGKIFESNCCIVFVVNTGSF